MSAWAREAHGEGPVDEALQEMQRAFLELYPECLADNAPGENAPESSEAMAE